MLSELDDESAAAVSEEGKQFEDKGVQTGSDAQDLVQISVTLPELQYRIQAYQRYKRYQLDISNQLEFCHHVDGCESTCARTDAAYFRRSSKNHKNPPSEGKQLTMFEKFQKSMLQEKTTTWERSNRRGTPGTGSLSLQGLTERISNMEQFLAIQGGNRPKDLLARVTQLELRLLAVEGQSQEYQHSHIGNKSLPSNKY